MLFQCNLFVIGQSIMKHHLFRISNKSKPQTEGEGHFSKGLSEQIASLSESIQLFGRSIGRSVGNEVGVEQHIEARDRSIEVEVASLQNEPSQQRQSIIKKWFASMVKTVVSSSFYWYSRGEMTFSEAKVFCSENILRNLNNLDDKWSLSGEELRALDRFVEEDILTYIASKYPLSQSTEVSKRLEESIRQIDNIDSIRNDYFKPAKVVFQYRESGNYNDLIMVLLNDLIKGIDYRKEIDVPTVYGSFEAIMTDLFEKVGDWDWIHSGKSIVVPENQKSKYRQKVREYTSYAIGRKFSENTQIYDQNEIQSLHVRIRSPQILRILTKWCEQLWTKLSIPNFYTDGLGQCSLQDGKIVNLSADHRNYLDNCIQEERPKIIEQLNQLKLNNYQLQSEILKLRALSEEHQVQENEAACGKFSVKVMRNLHVYLVTYLNRLIHALTGISLKLHQYLQLETTKGWQKPPNLITLRLGDLMRCRCSSKETQIIRLYEQLEKKSRETPQLLKIIRVKNRLRKGTNDILINVRFKETYLCQIQLSIKSKVTDTAKRYNQYAHFLYELIRTMFGPITEICSIWASLDSRNQIYEKLVEKEKVQAPMAEHLCEKLRKSYQLVAYSNPFICSLCGCHYSHDNFIFHPLKCSSCSFFKCCKCQIESDSESEMLAKLAAKNKFLQLCRERIPLNDHFPGFGLCIYIESKVVKPQPFQLIYESRRTYLLAEEKGTIYQIWKIDAQKDKAKFFEKYLIMSAYRDESCSFWDVDRDELVKKYVLREKVRQNYIKQKESINLQERWLTAQDCSYILSSGDVFQRRNIVNIFLNKNNIQDITFLPSLFENIRWLQLGTTGYSLNNLDSNQFTDILPICSCKSLVKLSMSSCQIEQIPQSFKQLADLQQLQLADNKLTRLGRVLNISRLRIVNLEGNKIQSIDDGYFEGNIVQNLNLSKNEFEVLPDSLGKLSSLRQLLMSNNTVKVIPVTISSLLELSVLDLSSNCLSQLPDSVCELIKLKVLKLSSNQIEKICPKVGSLRNLKEFHINENKIVDLPQSFRQLKEAIVVDLCANLFQSFPFQVTQLSSLKGLKANQNKFNILPSELTSLSNLNYLQLVNCELKTIEFDYFYPFAKLRHINLSSNQLQRVPSFKNCFEIVQINLQFNQITELAQDFLQGLVKLQKLNLSCNELVSFPAMGIQPNLKQLKLDSNKIALFRGGESISLPKLRMFSLNDNDHPNIPTFLFNCPKLQQIHLTSNTIQAIPPSIAQITTLKQLHLACNNIRAIPPQMGKLANLYNLNLATNHITNIPVYLDKLPNLRLFCLMNNEISQYKCDRQTIYKMDDETRRKYFQSIGE